MRAIGQRQEHRWRCSLGVDLLWTRDMKVVEMRGCEMMGSMIVQRAQQWVDEGHATGLQAGVARSKLEKQGQRIENCKRYLAVLMEHGLWRSRDRIAGERSKSTSGVIPIYNFCPASCLQRGGVPADAAHTMCYQSYQPQVRHFQTSIPSCFPAHSCLVVVKKKKKQSRIVKSRFFHPKSHQPIQSSKAVVVVGCFVSQMARRRRRRGEDDW